MNIKPFESKRKLFLGLGIARVLSLAVILLAVFALGGAAYIYLGGEKENTVEAAGGYRIIRLPAGGNLQTAIDRAEAGDVIELQAGATYAGNFKMPNKPFKDFVTVRSSLAAKLPEGQRVSPKDAQFMAKITSRSGSAPILSAEHGANHFRFIGIEFTPGAVEYVYNLILFGVEEKTVEDLPRDLEIDRCYLHPNKAGKTRRGIALNSANTIIRDSYIEGFAYQGEETQAICGWTGTKNVKILNNHIEGGAENIMFGGDVPAAPQMIPTDIEVRGNYILKPDSWKGTATTKCLFELKSAKRVVFTNNYLENNWVGAAFRITLRAEDGKAPLNTIEDAEISNNLIDGAGDGVQILGRDDYSQRPEIAAKLQTLKRLKITNNVFLNLGGSKFEGSGYFIQVSDGENIKIANNTVFNEGNIASHYGTVPRFYEFTDNIVNYGEYGVHGLESVKSPTARKFYQRNIVMNAKKLAREIMPLPDGNTIVNSADEVGFANWKNRDLQLLSTSKFVSRTPSQKSPGANLKFDSSTKTVKQ